MAVPVNKKFHTVELGIANMVAAANYDYNRFMPNNEDMQKEFANGWSMRYGKKYIKIVNRNSAWGFIVNTENDKKIAYKKADDIKKKINSYDDFYEQASSFSDDETNKSKGGYMGMIDIKEYQVPEISEVLKTIDINSVSSPILTNFGYHLVWVDEIISGGPATLEKNWLDIEGLALNKKKSDWYNDWINTNMV